MAQNKLVKKLQNLDIMPLGKRETKTITKTKTELPLFKRLLKVDSEKLFYDFKKYSFNDSYLKSRSYIFEENEIDVDEYISYMNSIGFSKDTYRVLPLRDTDGNLTIEKDTHTYEFLNGWPTGIFRPQYNVTLDNWEIKSHIDYNDDSVHGFRVLIPLNKSSFMIVDGQEIELEVNYSYFINVTKPHSAWSNGNRVVLSFQMNSDALL